MRESNYNIELIKTLIELYSDLNKGINFTANDVKLLFDYIKTLEDKNKQYNDLILYLNREIINLTEELNKLEL